MLESWRTKLRQAQDAHRQGRLNDAARLIQAEKLQDYAPGQKLTQDVSHDLAQRAVGRMTDGDCTGAWSDYDQALRVSGMTLTLSDVGSHLELLGTKQVEHLLASDRVSDALRELDALEHHSRTPRTTALRNAARHLTSADELCARGRFNDALGQLERAKNLLPDLPGVGTRQKDYELGVEQIKMLENRLFNFVSIEKWSQALTTADEILELAPEHRMATDARRRAWSFVDKTVPPQQPSSEPTQPWNGPATAPANAAVLEKESLSHEERLPRFLLWVDGVGGFLVCQNEEVSLGQAIPNASVDISIQADVSRDHATVRRDGEGYVLIPKSRVMVNGSEVTDRTLLRDQDELTLGEVVKLRFCKPHALSATARLDFVSRHRTCPAADSILLMAESCVLGPRLQNHVICRDWEADVVLFKQDGTLFCRSLESIEIDGEKCEGRGRVSLDSRIVGEDFSMSLEPIE